MSSAISTCQKSIDDLPDEYTRSVELQTWLDM
jgi:hypothetical protein